MIKFPAFPRSPRSPRSSGFSRSPRSSGFSRSPRSSGFSRSPRSPRFSSPISLISLAVLLVFVPIVALGLYFGGRKAVAAWSPTMGDYAKRQMLNIVNNSGDSLASTTTVAVTVDTKTLFNNGYLQADCDDLRVVYQPDSATYTELDRHLVYPYGTGCTSSTATKVYFSLQADLADSATATTYYMYYSNSKATTPTDTDNAFDIGSAEALLVCPFEGSTTCAAGETPSTESGAIRYSAGKSALSFDGVNDYVSVPALTNADGTIEFWFKQKAMGTSGVGDFYFNKYSSAVYDGLRIVENPDRSIEVGYNYSDLIETTPIVTYGQWTHLALTFGSQGMSLYINGVNVGSNVSTVGLDDLSQSTMIIGNSSAGTSDGANVDIDEFRISNFARYTAAFTPQTTPFVRDEYTKLLLHFDENGDDPRNTGKAIDDSGNANHGTITGAKYVAGLVGVDASSVSSGYQSVQSYAAHDGIFIEEGTTNKITNPSFEHGTYNTNWDAVGANLTASQNTTAPYYKFGSNSLKLIASASAIDGVSNMDTIGIDPDSTATHMLSFYAYDGTTGNVGGTVSSSIVKPVWEGVSQTGGTYTDMGGGWWRVTYATTTTDSTNEYGVEAQVSKTVYIDGVQLEAKAYATTYTDGALGNGYAWTGTANESTSTRTVSDVKFATSGNMDVATGSISLWLKMNKDVSGGDYNTWLFDTRATGTGPVTGTNGYTAFLQFNNIYFKNMDASENQSTLYGTFTNYVGYWKHIVLTWSSGTVQKIYLNGSDVTTISSQAYSTSTNGSTLNLGDVTSASYDYKINGQIADFHILNTNLTSAQVADLYYSGLVSHQETSATEAIDRFSTDKGQNPVAVYHFDEGYGATAHDSTTYLNHLTISGASWVAQSPQSSRSPGSLFFDGSNDYLSRSFDRDFDFGTGSFTISGLFKHPSTVSDTDTILAKHGDAGYKVYMNSSGYICFGIDDDSSFDPDDSACSTTSYADSEWHSFSAVKDGTTSITLYIDSLQIASDSSLNALNSLNSPNTLYLGIDTDAASNPWDGFLDEIVIYPYARSAAQVKVDNLGEQIAVAIGGRTEDNLTDGLVGWWKMDETATPSLDSSGNGLNGAWANNATYGTGKYGNGLVLDGTHDYSLVNDSNAFNTGTQLTISGWAKFDTFGSFESILAKQSQYVLYVTSSGSFAFYIYGNSANCLDLNTSLSSLSADTWYHFSAAYDGQYKKLYVNGQQVASSSCSVGTITNSDQPVYIGTGVSDTAYDIDGTLDDVRIYNRALSPAEVSQLYEWAPGPVAHWNFDEGSGQSANDISGNANTGTLTNGPTWTNGKYGKGVKFDGVNDYVDRGTGPTVVNTVSFWVKPTTTTEYPIDLNGTAYVWINSGTVTAQGFTGATIYVNGVVSSTVTAGTWQYITVTTATALNATDLDIGRIEGVGYLEGSIDDVRIYNYARTQKQIVQDMLGGGSVIASGARQSVSGAIAYYDFDEGYGTTANNSGNGGNNLNGTLTNMSSPATSTSGWTNSGKYGKGLVFDNSNDYVLVLDNNSLDPGTAITYSAWVKSIDASTGFVMQKLGSGSYGKWGMFIEDASGTVRCRINENAISASLGIIGTSDDWHHLVCTYDSVAGYLRAYTDGKLISSAAYSTALADGGNLQIGGYSTWDYGGSIDEVKIYNYALSAEEVKLDYNAGSAMVLGALSTESDGTSISNSISRSYCVPGDTSTCDSPVAEWSFDEGTGQYAQDTSGNANTGTLTNGPIWTNGKYGKGVKFDGTDDYIDLGSSSTLIPSAITVEAWVNTTPNALEQYDVLMSRADSTGAGWRLWTRDSSSFKIYWEPTGSSYSVSSSAIPTGQWVHIAGTTDANGTKLYINGKLDDSDAITSVGNGSVNAAVGAMRAASGFQRFWPGSIDDVKIYDYARTAAQVAWDYNRGGPVAYYDFDECQGTTINSSKSPLDSSSGSSDLEGTLVIGATGTNTSAGTCADGSSASAWYNGRTGKYSSSMSFDGVDDYVNISENSIFDLDSRFSASAWIKTTSPSSSQTIIVKEDTTNNRPNYAIDIGDSKLRCFGYSGSSGKGILTSSGATLNADTWYHVACSFDGTTWNTYINGKLNSTAVDAATLTTYNNGLNIGYRQGLPGRYFSGLIDEVKIFNYALTSQQVKTEYTGGAVRFGN